MRLAALILACGCLHGQPAGPLSFDVASLKVSAPDPPRGIRCSGGPGTSSPAIFRCSNVPLAFLITQAYGFEAWQFPKFAPCCRDRFDVEARLPAGATTDQFHEMLRTLLVDRLGLKLHYDRKELPAYELTIAEGGPKMKTASPSDIRPAAAPWDTTAYTMGKDGYPVFPPGQDGLAGPNGHYRWTAHGVSMQEIAKTLSFELGRPVIDATGLAGRYNLNLTWVIDVAWLLESAGRRDEIPEDASRGARGPGLIRAVREQLGLELRSTKAARQVVVVDHVEKVPNGN